MHHVLVYDLAPDYLARRTEFRVEHLALAWKLVERDELMLDAANPVRPP